jgi:glycosyltransferase involved in cell wall biosynthesis
MYEGKTIGVVVPAYNEATLLGGVIETMPAFVDRVYVIDDASTDGTWAELSRHAAAANERREPEATLPDGGEAGFVVPIRHEHNRGPGGARKTGYARALADGLDVVATMDADGQMDPAHLGRIVAPVVADEVAYAKGTRLKSREFWRGMPPFRLFGNLLLTFLTKVASGYWAITDPQNGYTAISREALAEMDIEALYDDYGYLNDVLTSLNVRSKRVADVSHPARYGGEHSGIEYSTFVPSLSGVLLRNFLRRLRTRYLLLDFNPLAFLYGLGVFGLGVGVLSGLGAAWTMLAACSASPTEHPSTAPSTPVSAPPPSVEGSSPVESPSAEPSSIESSSEDSASDRDTASGPDSAYRPAAARGVAALEALLFGVCVLALAIVFDSRANEDLVVRIGNAGSGDRSAERPAPDRPGGPTGGER